MRKIKLTYFIFLVLFGLSACELPDNVDPKSPTEVPVESLFANAEVAFVDQVNSLNVNANISRILSQQVAQTTYYNETRYNFLDRNIPDAYFANFYRDVLMDLARVRELTEASDGYSPAMKANRLAVVDVIEVYSYMLLVDAFGNVPYTDAVGGASMPNPTYDDAATIYTDLLARISASISAFDVTDGSFGSYDFIFHGDVASWKTFAASLKLKMALRIADVDATAAQTAGNAAIATGVFANGERAALDYIGVTPYSNSVYEQMIQGGRKDYVPSELLIDLLSDLQDPRINLFLTAPVKFSYKFKNDDGSNKDTTFLKNRYLYYLDKDDNDSVTVYAAAPHTILAADSLNVFHLEVGGIFGEANTYSGCSRFTASMLEATAPAILIDYAEVEFMLAEAAERNWTVAGTAEEHYNNAVAASIEDWGGSAADATAYLAQAEVAYTTATGTWKEVIGTQKWIALFNRGDEAWAEYRRLDAPTFYAPVGLTSADIPTRMPYPFNEDQLNKANLAAAAAAINGDYATTKLFWDVN